MMRALLLVLAACGSPADSALRSAAVEPTDRLGGTRVVAAGVGFGER